MTGKYFLFSRTAEIDKAKSRIRIHLNIFFMFAAVVAALGYIRYGKHKQALGETIPAANWARKKAWIEERKERERQQQK